MTGYQLEDRKKTFPVCLCTHYEPLAYTLGCSIMLSTLVAELKVCVIVYT